MSVNCRCGLPCDLGYIYCPTHLVLHCQTICLTCKVCSICKCVTTSCTSYDKNGGLCDGGIQRHNYLSGEPNS